MTILLLVIAVIAIIVLAQKASTYEKDISNIQSELENSNQALSNTSKELKDCKDKLAIIDNYERHLRQVRNETNELIQKTKDINTISDYKGYIKQLEDEIKKLMNEIKDSNITLISKTIDISDYENITSEECKNKLSLLKNTLTDLIKDGKAVKVINETSKSQKSITNYIKQILLCFNAQCATIIDGLSSKNIDASRSKIQKAYDTINKVFEINGIQLTNNLLDLKLQELTLVYAYLVKKEEEKEEQKAIREQMLEEEKVRREIEREKAKLEKEENQFKNEITKLMGYLQKASDVEKQLYVDKIKELEDRLKQVEKDKENVLQREQNTRAGYVYVISNIGSFGDNVYKIGMTRRLEPMDRVKELSDASVPFEFDVHAMIFSDDAPGLETILHNTFRGKEVNKVNLKKEFYKVSLDDVERVVKENYNATVTFTKIAEAAQYRETLKIEASQSGNLSQNI